MRLPLPGAPSSSLDAYSARARALVQHPNMKVIVAFWLFGKHQHHFGILTHHLTTCRPDKQRPLCHNTLSRPRPRRYSPKRHRSARGRRSILLHEAYRAILYPPCPVSNPNLHILRTVVYRHALGCADTTIQVCRRQDGWRRAC